MVGSSALPLVDRASGDGTGHSLLPQPCEAQGTGDGVGLVQAGHRHHHLAAAAAAASDADHAAEAHQHRGAQPRVLVSSGKDPPLFSVHIADLHMLNVN